MSTEPTSGTSRTAPKKPALQTTTTLRLSTRIELGIALGLLGSFAIAAYSVFWLNLQRLGVEVDRSSDVVVERGPSAEERVAVLTRQLLTPGRSAASQRTVALERAVALRALAELDPITAQQHVVTGAARGALDESVRAAVEQAVELPGTLEVIVAETLEEGTHRYDLAVVGSDGARVRVHAPNPASFTALGGRRVTARGFRLDAETLLLAADGTVPALTSDGTTGTTAVAGNAKKALVLLFNFANDTRQPLTADAARSAIFTANNAVSRFVQEGSYNAYALTGKVRSDGDVLGWFTLPSTYNSATQSCSTAYRTWSDAARQLATEAGNDITGYGHYLYIFPRPSSPCPGWSWAEVPGDENWINDFKTPTLAHEHGHNWGLPHASTYRCYAADGTPTTLSTNCSIDEYGDPFSIMGGGLPVGYFHYAGSHRRDIGWLDSGSVQEVTASGTYTLAPVGGTSGVRTLRIPRNRNAYNQVSEYLWLEYRQPSGFDAFTATDPVVNGVSLRLSPERTGSGYVSGTLSVNSLLLDTTPATTSFLDAPLAVGQTFSDPAYGITVRTVTVAADQATVEITLAAAACTTAAPTVMLTPANGTYGSPGQGLTYYLNVTNADSANCPSSTFEVSPTLPTGWSQSPATTTFTLAPGAFRQTTLTVSSDPAATAAVYAFTEVVRNTTADRTSTVSGSYTVTGPDTVAPTVTVTSPKNGATVRGKTLKVSATTSDLSGIARIEILIDGTVRYSCAGTTGCTYSAPLSTLPNGTHSIVVRATDASPNANVGTATVTVVKK